MPGCVLQWKKVTKKGLSWRVGSAFYPNLHLKPFPLLPKPRRSINQLPTVKIKESSLLVYFLGVFTLYLVNNCYFQSELLSITVADHLSMQSMAQFCPIKLLLWYFYIYSIFIGIKISYFWILTFNDSVMWLVCDCLP